jgi:mRNA interferase RelE/StbE
LSADAERDLSRLSDRDASRILKAVEKVARDPFGPGLNVKRLHGVASLRLRVGDFRVIYEVDRTARDLLVLRVRARKNAY